MIQTTRKGLEPSTSAVTGRRSNQLSHRAILFGVPSKSHTVNYFSKLFSLHPFSYHHLVMPSTD